MNKLGLLFLVVSLCCASRLSADVMYAVDSSRTSLYDGTNSEADDVKADTDKLSIRGDNKAAKSWIKFDISGLDVSTLAECQLRITLLRDKSSTCLLSAVNDDCTDNINWTRLDLTWNNAPGNYTSGDGVNADMPGVSTGDLQDNLDPAKTTLIATVDYTGGVSGDTFLFDVLPYLQADTDGIVQFVLHGAGGSTDFTAHTYDGGYGGEDELQNWHPALVYASVPTGNCPDVGIPFSSYAVESCRTELYDGSEPRVDDNRHDSSKLSVRGDYKANKSWIKFDLSDLGMDPNNLKAATLRVTLHEGKNGSCLLSAVNDDCLDNIDWTQTDLTWNNAPGNITSTDGQTPDDAAYSADDLQDNLVPAKTTSIDTVDYTYGGLAGDQFFFNVLPILQADTDGIVQFVLHGASGYTNFATHDHGGGEAYWPLLEILQGPAGADDPYPCPGENVESSLVGLSWTNPDPNDGLSPITCTVYLGTEPNRLLMDSVTLTPNADAVLINTANFPNYGDLQNLQTYYWIVDCDDPSAGLIPGMVWDFTVNNNEPPMVDAGVDQAVWLGMSGTPGQETVNLDAITSDDGLPINPGTYTVLWTQTAGPVSVPIDPNNVEDTSVTLTQPGDYEFTLTADDQAPDNLGVSSDAVRIVVGEDACDASHIFTGDPYDPGDVNRDCLVDLEDFALLIAENWLDCTNTLTGCE